MCTLCCTPMGSLYCLCQMHCRQSLLPCLAALARGLIPDPCQGEPSHPQDTASSGQDTLLVREDQHTLHRRRERETQLHCIPLYL